MNRKHSVIVGAVAGCSLEFIEMIQICPMHTKGLCKNNFGDYGAGILAAGEARATSIPCQWVCEEQATKPAGKRPSQICRSYSCTSP